MAKSLAQPSERFDLGGARMDRLFTMSALVRVVETGSFSAAARNLRVGQPAVSKAIGQLEERLGVRLLLRSPRGLRPTEAGQRFYEHARPAIENAEQAELAATTAGKGLSGRLRVSAPVTFARIHVIPRLPLLLKAHPALDVEVLLADREVDLIEEGVDIALRLGSLVESTLIARRLAQCPRLVMATPSYFREFGRPMTPRDLVGHQAVIYAQRGGGTDWTFQQDTEEVSVSLSGRLRVSAAEGIREAVLAGVGIAVASEWMFAPELRTGAVETALQDWQLPKIDLWAVYPTGRLVNAKARAFADFVESWLAVA
jgi:DNA-binding transcriptional LysR family regulator